MRCDRGNTFGTGCQNERAYKVERSYRDGSSTVSHECIEHTDESMRQPELFPDLIGVDVVLLKEPEDEA